MVYREIEKKILFINGDNATIKLSNDDVFIDVPNRVMSCKDDTEHLEVVLTEFTCNRDFYSVDDNNNSFGIHDGTSQTSYQIENGNPSVLDIDNQLKTDLEAKFTGDTFTVSFSRYTGKISISATLSSTPTAGCGIDFSVDNSAGIIYGFSNSFHAFTIDGDNVSLIGDKPVQVQGKKKNIYIRTSLVGGNNLENSSETGIKTENILGKIVVLTAPYNNINYYDGGGEIFRTKLSTQNLTGFNIRLTDEDNNLIGLNNNFLLTLTIYKMKEVDNIGNDYLKELLDIERLKFIKKNEENKNIN